MHSLSHGKVDSMQLLKIVSFVYLFACIDLLTGAIIYN
jgi:hypothetical protein